MKRIQACGSQSGEVKGQSRRVEWWKGGGRVGRVGSPEFLAKLGIRRPKLHALKSHAPLHCVQALCA